MKNIIYSILCISFILSSSPNDKGLFSISRIHYDGGGDWYADPSSLPNLLKFINQNTSIKAKHAENKVRIGDDIFLKNNYFYITGHGNINLSNKEILMLRQHLLNGAFLHVDDNYGLDTSFRKVVKDLFPDKEMIELPKDHAIFNCYYQFENGLPKIHEHNNQPAKAYGIFHNKKLILLYTYESDLGDGWEDQNVHNNPEYLRLDALKMGTNIVIYNLIQ